MKRIRITAVRKAHYQDLMDKYENPMENACNISVGDVFIVQDCRKPDGLCDSAWETLSPFVNALAQGGGSFYGNWMKNPHSAMVSCNDGFRPVSFLVEAMEE